MGESPKPTDKQLHSIKNHTTTTKSNMAAKLLSLAVLAVVFCCAILPSLVSAGGYGHGHGHSKYEFGYHVPSHGYGSHGHVDHHQHGHGHGDGYGGHSSQS